jgi:hypothetical protein
VNTEGRIKIISWHDSKPLKWALLSTADRPFIGSLGSSSIQECYERIATGPNFVRFLLEVLSSHRHFSPYSQSPYRSLLHRVQWSMAALYCTCCDWNLPKSAMRASYRRPSYLITGSSFLEVQRGRHTIPHRQSDHKTDLYKPQHDYFQAHNFMYLLSAGHSVFECKIEAVNEPAERAWTMLLTHENHHVHSNFEFCKLTVISRLDTS